MFVRRASKALAVSVAATACGLSSLAISGVAGANPTGPGASGNTITNAAQAQSPFSPGTFDSGQPVNVVVPANSVLTPGASIFILECAAPGGVDPTTTASCDGTTGYQGGTITVDADGSVNVVNSNTGGRTSPTRSTRCRTKSACRRTPPTVPPADSVRPTSAFSTSGKVGGGDTGMTAPHFFSQAFQVHPDPTDSGTLNPGDGTFPADSAPGPITTANHATFTENTTNTFDIAATGYGPPTYTETGALPTGVKLTTTFSGLTSSGVLSGRPHGDGELPDYPPGLERCWDSDHPGLYIDGQRARRSFTSANSTTFTQGSAGTFTATATGFPAPTFNETGALPAGVDLHQRRCPLRDADSDWHIPDHHHSVERRAPERDPALHADGQPAGGLPDHHIVAAACHHQCRLRPGCPADEWCRAGCHHQVQEACADAQGAQGEGWSDPGDPEQEAGARHLPACRSRRPRSTSPW